MRRRLRTSLPAALPGLPAHPAQVALALAALSLAALSLAACGDDETTGSGGAGGSDTSATTQTASTADATQASTSTGSAEGTFAIVTGPDRTHVTATWAGEAAPPAEAAAYALTSERGDLVIATVTVDPAARTVTLETDTQKLGVTYTLTVASSGTAFDGTSASFLAADRVDFWATEFDFFGDYVVSATRVAVGDHAVLYLEDGVGAGDIEVTRDRFDQTIYPIERDLFREPPDRDDNGRIVLLGLDGRDWYGGYFSPVNIFSEEEAQSRYGAHSNEMEIIYFNAAIMGGFDSEGVVPHEYQHLLYAEEHGPDDPWNWLNEGLAECAVNAVWGENDRAVETYADDPEHEIRDGISLVDWQYANYSQYAQAFVFLSYAAGQLGGVDGYGELFHAPSGDPRDIDELFADRLGRSFAEVQLDMLTAAWLEEDSGRYSFEDLLGLSRRPHETSYDRLDLPTFGGALFEATADGIAPTDAGPDVLLRGISPSGEIFDEAPYDVRNGVVIALNGLLDASENETQSSGTIAPPARPAIAPRIGRRALDAWLHAPPVAPGSAAMRRYREATRGLVAR